MSPLHAAAHGEGLPLLLLHGFTGSSADWRHVFDASIPPMRRITVDLPGHGRSLAALGPAVCQWEALLTALAAVLDRFDVERAAVLGYSMGGRLALAFALAYPQRVSALVLEGASPGISDAAERAARRVADEALAESIERQGIASFVDAWMGQPLFASQARLGPAVLGAERQARLANDPHSLAASLRALGSGVQERLWNRLAELAMPVLLVAGEEDAKFRRIATEMAVRIGDARVAVIARAGHNIHLENRRVFETRVQEFLCSRATTPEPPVLEATNQPKGGIFP